MNHPRLTSLLGAALYFVASLHLSAQLRITTSQYDNARTGANPDEHILSPRNVNVRQFGKLFTLPVDGDVYAQPLYLSRVNVPGRGVHDVLFIATENDSVYAFDASGKPPEPLWHARLLPSKTAAAPLTEDNVDCPFIRPNIGITSTPVIDVATGTLYVLARSKTWSDGAHVRFHQHLHALAITNGVEKFGGPVEIRASVKGSGDGSTGGEIVFNALRENPRGALLLAGRSVYLTWASSCDVGAYHGWVMAYDAQSLRQQAVFTTSPDAAQSGIWLSDTGPAADLEGNIFVVTGNGAFDADHAGGRDYGDTALKLALHNGQFVVKDYFTPSDEEQLNARDGDLGSGGPLLLPGGAGDGSAKLIFGGKAGVMYVIRSNRMGHLLTEAREPEYQRIKLSSGIYSAPALWKGHLYYFGESDSLKDFPVQDGRVASHPAFESEEKSAYSGATPTVSSDGNQGGVVWVIETKAWNARRGTAVLMAYDAANVSRRLYASTQNPNRDEPGEALRFTIPTVASGRVYVGVKNGVSVYGLLPSRSSARR